MNNSINVLTPNGRRQNVKVQPNTPILKVLEEVCEKHKFDPNEYDLKHHKRIVDLSTSFRFSGLPNNAQLEMVEAQKKRQDAIIELVVQLSDGNRLNGQFKTNSTVLEIVQQLCPNESTNDLVAIFMRTEVANDKLGVTSLKDLGLISGGGIIRLMHRSPDAAKIQANVALNLQPKPVEKPDDPSPQETESKIQKTDEAPKVVSKPIAEASEVAPQKMETNQSAVIEETVAPKEIEEKQLLEEAGSSQSAMEVDDKTEVEDDEGEDDGVIHILGPRNAVVFALSSSKTANFNEMPDSFFDLNVNDIKLLLKELRAEQQGTTEQPLMTAKLREFEEDKQRLDKLNRYKKAIIRIQFPNRYVLQGTFTPYEKIEDIMEFIKSYLNEGDLEFYLYTTPPKTILSKELQLFAAHCVPSAVIHFGSEHKRTNYLKEELLDKLSSPVASLKQALSDRGLKMQVESKNVASTSISSNESFNHSGSAVQPKPSSSNIASSSSTANASDAKVPKWFKGFKQ